jgi:mannose-6-phosphate isomerase-like protein (cupin superfamily)
MTTAFDGVVLGPGEGRRATVAGTAGAATATVLVKATGDETRGAYTLRETSVAARQPPVQAHIHHAMEEGFFVLEGRMGFRLGEREVTMGAGAFVLVPRGVIHTFSNPDDAPARCLILFSPPGFERYFEELAGLRAASADGLVERSTLAALAARYHTEYFDLPPRV